MTKRKKPPTEAKPEQGSRETGTPPLPLQEHIGRRLKAMFDEVVEQPVPDRFRELLDELARKQAKK